MKPAIEKKVIEHGNKLNAIFHTGIEPLKLCRALRRIEREAHKLAEDACNYLSTESTEFTNRENKIKIKPGNLAQHQGVFINFDPRGYALKIDDEYMRAHNLKLYTDWGGYGILAPDFS